MKALKIQNFRDVSGYKNCYGEVMKENCIFRGGPLNNLSLEEVKVMEEELGIRYILDYRDEKEANMAPDVSFPSAVYERIGALRSSQETGKDFDFGSVAWTELTEEKVSFMLQFIEEGYRQMPFCNPAYRRLFEILLENNGHVYFHCSAGKDRTGVSAFLIMMALGISEEDGIREYLLSNRYYEGADNKMILNMKVPEEKAEILKPLLLVHENFIRSSIEAIKSRYNSYEEYFEQEYGLDEEKRRALRAICCQAAVS